jgi:glycosyltransferase involved in cell wall biosynthesis
MRIASITAGAAGMFCGSCMKDNALAAALREQGHDALLVPTYTPIRTDEADVSTERVFFGGINVYLQEKFWLFRHTPWLFDRLLDARRLLRWVSPLAARTRYDELGPLTVSMLEGTHGHQRKEVEKLADWLEAEVKPEVVLLTNVLLSGIVPELRRRLGVPVVATLQGDDIFLDALPEAYRRKCAQLIRENGRDMNGYIATSGYYADYMANYLGLDRETIHVVYPGISLKGHGTQEHLVPVRPPYRVGYYARVCPEKGFDRVVDAFIRLRQTPDAPACRLRASGWLGDNHRPFFDEQVKKLALAGLADDFEYVPTPDHESKVRFLNGIDVLSVPTTYREPKGLYVLEAWANGVPVVLPAHGAFPELVGSTGGGLLVEPNDTAALADGLRQVLADPAARDEMGRRGKAAVAERFTAAAMARETAAVLARYVDREAPARQDPR